jgi:putative ABC transport system substrate-binding protein
VCAHCSAGHTCAAAVQGSPYRLSGGQQPGNRRDFFEVFKQRLAELGYVDGKDVEFEYRWAHGKAERFPQLAQELVALQPDVILVTGGRGALAAEQATKSIPIVVVFQPDPVASGLAKSLARPGGNVTGLADFTNEAAPKRLELLLAVVPQLRRLVVLWPAADPQAGLLKSLQAAAQTVGVDVVAIEVSSSSDIGASFTRMTREQAARSSR